MKRNAGDGGLNLNGLQIYNDDIDFGVMQCIKGVAYSLFQGQHFETGICEGVYFCRMSLGQKKESLSLGTLMDDMLCLKTMWFSKASGGSHKDRLESFYKPQAEACKWASRRWFGCYGI